MQVANCQLQAHVKSYMYLAMTIVHAISAWGSKSLNMHKTESPEETRTLHTVLKAAQLAERRSLAGELTPSCARPAADG